MRKFGKKKLLVAGAAVALVATGGGVALAYWSTTGSGTGSATTANDNGTVTLHASFPDAQLAPGVSVPVSFTADNASASSLRVGTVHSVVAASGTCDAKWFSIGDVAENQTIPAKSTDVALTNSGTLAFADTADNQDACKGATITLTLSSN